MTDKVLPPEALPPEAATRGAAALGPARVELPNRRATRRLARAIGAALAPGDALILSGALGAGKTFLVRALCRALGLPEREPVQSPTFTLLREWPTQPPIAHADLYRLGSLEEAEQLGLLELRDAGAVLIAEWGERFPSALGRDCLALRLDLAPRRATLSADGPRSRQLLQAICANSDKYGAHGSG